MVFKSSLAIIVLSVTFISCATNSVVINETIIPEKSLYDLNIDAAEEGSIEAQLKIGISYEEGIGVSADYDEAYNWYRKAASKGSSEAYYRIGTFYENGYSVGQNRDKALDWYLSSASTGYLRAIRKLIGLNEDNREEQLKWIERGMSFGDPYSYFHYALVLEETDPDLALEYFIKSEATEDSAAKGILSILSLSGRHPFFDNITAIKNIEEGAESGNARCQVFIGWLYEFGAGVEINKRKAFDFYEEASRSFEILSIYNLSRFYGEGIFVKINPHLSNSFFKQIPDTFYSPVITDLLNFSIRKDYKDQQRVLYRFLSSNNDIEAMYNLGLITDPPEAFQWFSMAADNGHTDAMRELAKVLIDDDSEESDPIQAAVWLMVAENKTGIIEPNFSSSQLLMKMSDEEKMRVSSLFTELFYSERIEESTDFLK